MNDTKSLRILQLYPRDMNIYGDWGNALVLQKRAQWHGYEVELLEYNPEDTFPENIDLIVGGGGQDSGQDKIQADLLKIAPKIKSLVELDVPILVVCGLYQLFGHDFTTKENRTIHGIGIFDMRTTGGSERMIGNIVIQSDEFGEIVGYENHSGSTSLANNVLPLGSVIKGAGNNLTDGVEGARYKNTIGTYLHGSLLPKNPIIADWLIERACQNKYGNFIPTVVDDRFASLAKQVALRRPR